MLFSILDNIGTIAFAISGALTAIEKRMDIFGVLMIAIVTAFGGGTLRDILIGNFPVTWLTDLSNFYVVTGSVVITILFRKVLLKLPLSLLFFDAIGLGIFTLIGIQKGLLVNLHPLVCVLLGTVTACFGGVIRDILCNEVPAIFHKEVYATACMAGGVVFFAGEYFAFSRDVIFISTIVTIIVIRLLAVRYSWSLPHVKVWGE
ncbi:trimeric intracellular cation channel family protein [Chitinophaga agri]|uniref:Trimeric intracellular cation channel family protein n=1 Tax=Chitinophaga agri TaxID=2703787 RepID=A0A6B9Z934_9BACT|nr:trimeric intracellular cation channel family protein [Chitinophaga agri]QHS58782.1 trimeric intracellular cation channel family protein [Chitinophaga agri]